MARTQPERGFNFTREMVADSDNIPTILRDFRSDAWRQYQEIPFPTIKDEAWRRTSLRGIDFQKIQLPNGKPNTGLTHAAASFVEITFRSLGVCAGVHSTSRAADFTPRSSRALIVSCGV